MDWHRLKNGPFLVSLALLDTLFGVAMGIAWLFGLYQHAPLLTVIAALSVVGLIILIFFVPYIATPTIDSRIVNSDVDSHAHYLGRTRQKITCPLCRGNTRAWGKYEETCRKCEGRGYIYTYRVGQPVCPQCRGNGRSFGKYEEPCRVCHAIGLQPYEENDQG